MYRGIVLGGRHEQKIIDILRQVSHDTNNDYVVAVTRYENTNGLDEMAMFPRKLRINGRVYYQIVYPRGWSVLIKVDSRRDDSVASYSLGSKAVIYVGNAGVFLSGRFGKSLLYEARKAATS